MSNFAAANRTVVRRHRTFRVVMGIGKKAREVFLETWKSYNRGDTGLLAGGIAFYSLLYAMPVVVIALGIAGAIFRGGHARQTLLVEIPKLVGPGAANAFELLLAKAESSSGATSIIGAVLLAYASTRLFSALRWAIDVMWNIPLPSAGSVWKEVLAEVRRRVVAFLLVLVTGLLFVVLVATKIALSAVTKHLSGTFAAPIVWHSLEWLVTVAFAGLGFSFFYKIIPDGRVTWRDASFGGAITAVLFSLGIEAIGAYVGRSMVAPDFGPAGPLLGLFVWTYYSAQIFLIGAALTAAFARMRGRAITPDSESAPASTPTSPRVPRASGAH
jgi:membrane protein